MEFRRSGRAAPEINLAPLIDVVFLLVLFFAVSTTFLETAGLTLDLPEASGRVLKESTDLTVSLDAAGRLELDGEDLEESELEDRLAARFRDDGPKMVVLQADAAVPHGTVVRIMDHVRKAGATGLTVAARPES